MATEAALSLSSNLDLERALQWARLRRRNKTLNI
jgi:hypothetical protein